MKFSIILAVVCFVLGAVISWVAKPDDQIGKEDNESGTPSPRSKRVIVERKTLSPEDIPRVLDFSEGAGEEDSQEKRTIQNSLEAIALTNYAKLLHLDLTKPQKVAAFNALYEQAETEAMEGKILTSPRGPESMIAEAKAQVEFQLGVIDHILDENQLEQYRKELEIETDAFLSRAISTYRSDAE